MELPKMDLAISSLGIQYLNKMIALDINERFANSDGVHFVGILNGAFFFMSDLMRAIRTTIPTTVGFVRLSSYRGATTSGDVKTIFSDVGNVKGKDVIIVDEIIDTGKTMAQFIEDLKKEEPRSISVCTLIDKVTPSRVKDIDVTFFGIRIVSDEFLVGYGLDINENFRNLPAIYKLRENETNAED